MALLDVVNRLVQRIGEQQTTIVVSSTNPQILQIKALLEEEINDLAIRHNWQSLTREATFTTIANEDQGDIETIATEGFRYILNNTIWDRTDSIQCAIVSAEQWQSFKGLFNVGISANYRFRGNHLLVSPEPAAGHTWAFEYQSKYGILDADSGQFKEFFTKDTDTMVLPESLHLQGLRWRWMREKGLDYAELFNTYELQVKNYMGRDGGAPNISFSAVRGIGHAIAPQGNWFI